MVYPKRRSYTIALHSVIAVVLVTFAAIQARYGSPELFGDDIAYLDISNCIRAGDWHSALNPYWSIAYPLAITAIRPFFASSVSGLLLAAACLNLLVFLLSWLGLLFFLKTTQEFLSPNLDISQSRPPTLSPVLLIAAACVFLTVEVCFGRVCTWGPDEMVACCFFFACALLLRFTANPTLRNGVLLGAVLGCGYIVKVIFLPLSVIFLACALLPKRRRLSRSIAFAPAAVLLAIMLPYVCGISWSMGRPNLGESGALNYAWSVNNLPHWMGWQGGPARLGYPLHPVHLLRDNPAVFAFGEPFHTTYPPQFNPEYWYDGYRHFFSLRNAARAFLHDLHLVESFFHENLFFTLGLLLSIGLLLYATPDRKPHLLRLIRLWPIYLPALLGMGLYLNVNVDARYILGFTAVLALIPFIVLVPPARPMQIAALFLLFAGSSANLWRQMSDPIHLAWQRAPVETAYQWRIAHFLTASGLHPGDRVASVDIGNPIRCTWAFGAGLRIVTSIGNDAYNPHSQQQDFDLFWRDPATQADVLRLFRGQGAVAVVVQEAAGTIPPLSASWQHIPNTYAWLLRITPPPASP